MFVKQLLHLFKRFSHPALLIAIVLAVIPFFWLSPGVVDLGGDSGRLYFYDPLAFIKQVSLYSYVQEGLGSADPNTYYTPYVLFLAFLKLFLVSPTMVISVIHGLKMSIGFLAMYAVVKHVVRNESSFSTLAGIMAGIFYIFAPNMIGNYDKALTSHNQVFLNPLVFYLLFKFLVNGADMYLYAAILISFVFAPNFALTSAPAFFAFYPLTLCFLFIYVRVVLHQKIPWKKCILGGLLFIGIGAFHLLPQFINLFDQGSFANTRVFDKTSIMHEGIRYFIALLPLASVGKNIFMTPMIPQLSWDVIIAPSIVIVGIFIGKKKKALMVLSLFYLIALYLYSAKITDVGVEVYKRLFYVPGFSMFRNFIGQWGSVYTFFYALLLGLSSYHILCRIGTYLSRVFAVVCSGLWIIGVWPFIQGNLVNAIHRQSNNVRMTFAMDPRYEETLNFIRSLPEDGKILTLPLTDSYYQVVSGRSGGAYVGTSTISQLTGKSDFNGYQILGPFAEDFMKYSREKNYRDMVTIFSKLSIRYIFHNSDPMIYEKGFPTTPYTYMRTSFPQTQQGYKEMIMHLPVTQMYENGPYALYELDESVRRPEIYMTDETGAVNIGKLIVKKIRPVEYTISLNTERFESGLLVFHTTFNKNWKLILHNKQIQEYRHRKIHGYANAWQIAADEFGDKNEYTMTLRLESQKYVLWGWTITIVSFVALGLLLIWGKIFRNF